MRKLYILVTALIVCSCSLDQYDKTNLDYSNAKTKSDLEGIRSGAYSMAAYLFTGTNAYFTDYMSDMFLGTIHAGGRGASYLDVALSSNDSNVKAMWGDAYRTIARVNSFLDKVDSVNDDDDELLQWKGEMYLLRAMMYRELALRFCNDYDPQTASSSYGVPIIKTLDVEYSGGNRGNLEALYDFINSDIASAEALLTQGGKAGSIYLTSDCVTAFKAQVALDMHRYSEAVAYCNTLISNTNYSLSVSRDALLSLWGEDSSNEIIFMFDLTQGDSNPELPFTIALPDNKDLSFFDVVAYQSKASVTLCGWLYGLYESIDWRLGSYVKDGDISSPTPGSTAIRGSFMSKFSGAANLQESPGVAIYRNRPKVFTLADIYLIKAEAEHFINSDAASTLSEFRSRRGYGANSVVSSGAALLKAIQDECAMEFVGEGRRLSDLKRWKVGVNRDVDSRFSSIESIISTTKMEVQASHWSLTLPIPSTEFSLNTELRGQQNSGYSE